MAAAVLPIGLFPKEGEHPGSYVRRLAVANGLNTVAGMLALGGMRSLALASHTSQWQQLADLAGIPRERLSSCEPRLTGGTMRPGLIDGQPFPFGLVDMRSLRLCHGCVHEFGVLPLRSAIRGVTACVRHGYRLKDDCGCGRRLRAIPEGVVWTCSDCGADPRDLPPEGASTEELAVASLFEPSARNDRWPSAPTDLFDIPMATRAAAVEQLGRIVMLDRNDSPASFRGDYGKTYPPSARAGRRIVEDRRVVAAAHEALSDWPTGYHRLLESLLDRYIDMRAESIVARRFGSRAGRLAMNKAQHLHGADVEFVASERAAYLARRIEHRPGEKVRLYRSRSHEPGRPMITVGPDGPDMRTAIPLSSIIKQLHVGGASSIVALVEAGLLERVDFPNIRFAATTSSVDALRERLRTFRAEGDDHSFEPASKLTRHTWRDYPKREFLIDLFSDRIRARQALDGGRGLRSLQLHRGDFDRRQALPTLLRRMARDDFLTRKETMALIRPIWGEHACPTGKEVSAAGRSGAVRTGLELRPRLTYSVLDVARLIASRTSTPFVSTDPEVLAAIEVTGWRSALLPGGDTICAETTPK